MSQNAQTRSRVEATLLRKAWTDAEFKKQLLSEPTATYAAELAAGDRKLPSDVRVEAVEESSKILYFVLPEAPSQVPPSTTALNERSTRAEFEGAMVLRAWQDEDFRRQLLSDSRSAYESYLKSIRPGAKLPQGIEVKVLQETPNTLYLRIPQAPAEAVELSEEELEKVAGGAAAVGVAIASYVVVGAVAVAALLVAEQPTAE